MVRLISWGQLALLLTATRMAPIVCFTPALTGQRAMQCWQSSVLGVAIAAPLLALAVLAAQRFPGRTLIQWLPDVLGKPLGRAVGLLYLFFWFHSAVQDSRMLGETLKNAMLPEFPLFALMGSMAILMVWAVRSGLVVMGRFAQLTMPWCVGLIVAAMLLVFKDIYWDRLIFKLEYGVGAVAVSALTPISLFADFTLILMLAAEVDRLDDLWKAVYTALLICGTTLVMLMVSVIGLMGDTAAHRLTMPFLTLARQIQLGAWIENMEAVVMVTFLVIWLLKGSLCVYAVARGIEQMAGLTDYRPLAAPLSALLIALAGSLAANVSEIGEFNRPQVLAPYALLFGYGLPALLLLVAWIRGKPDKAAPAAGSPAVGGR